MANMTIMTCFLIKLIIILEVEQLKIFQVKFYEMFQ